MAEDPMPTRWSFQVPSILPSILRIGALRWLIEAMCMRIIVVCLSLPMRLGISIPVFLELLATVMASYT